MDPIVLSSKNSKADLLLGSAQGFGPGGSPEALLAQDHRVDGFGQQVAPGDHQEDEEQQDEPGLPRPLGGFKQYIYLRALVTRTYRILVDIIRYRYRTPYEPLESRIGILLFGTFRGSWTPWKSKVESEKGPFIHNCPL